MEETKRVARPGGRGRPPLHKRNAKGLIRKMRPFTVVNQNSDAEPYTLNEEPQPQVLFTFGFSNLKPAPSSVST
jgi:hypothetical protein